MDWVNSGYSGLPFHVSALIAENGQQAVYDLLISASRDSSDPQRSDALAYLAAAIDTTAARAAAEKFKTAVANHKKKVEEYNKVYRDICNMTLSIDFKRLVFWDSLTEKAPSSFFLGKTEIRPFIPSRQPAELIDSRIKELNDEALQYKDSPESASAEYFHHKVVKFLTGSLVSDMERQVELYRYFTDFECLFSTYEQREKLSTHARFEVAPGKLSQLVEKGGMYRDVEAKCKKLSKLISKLGSCESQLSDMANQYNEKKSEVEKFIPYGLARYIDGYEKIRFPQEA